MKYKRATFDEETVKQLIDLSYVWEKEDITWGLRHNTKDDLEEVCYLALDKNRIVGYCFGHYSTNDKQTQYADVGERFFFISEIYVLPEYRNKGTGKKLFKLIEDEVKNEVTCITLATATKDYQRILKFYAQDLNMVFHDAFLFKKTK